MAPRAKVGQNSTQTFITHVKCPDAATSCTDGIKDLDLQCTLHCMFVAQPMALRYVPPAFELIRELFIGSIGSVGGLPIPSAPSGGHTFSVGVTDRQG